MNCTIQRTTRTIIAAAALALAGAAQAQGVEANKKTVVEFYNKAINDLSLSKGDRRNLIEDLNQDGFVDRKNLGARDLPLIENRIAIIEQLAPDATDPINLAAFQTAYKDLQKMRERILQPPPPKQKP